MKTKPTFDDSKRNLERDLKDVETCATGKARSIAGSAIRRALYAEERNREGTELLRLVVETYDEASGYGNMRDLDDVIEEIKEYLRS